MLSPVHYRRRTPRPVSYYALFKWWLLLSQHPGCLRNPTSFRTQHDLGTLAVGLGCFPLVHGAYPPRTHCRGRTDGIRSLVRLDTREGSLPVQWLYHHPSATRRCTKMHFGENQLLRCLSRLLLLSTAHRMIFHHQR